MPRLLKFNNATVGKSRAMLRFVQVLLGVTGLLCCSMSAYITIAYPKTQTVLDGLAWALLGLYVAGVSITSANR